MYFSPDSKQEVAAGAASPSYCPAPERTTVCSALTLDEVKWINPTKLQFRTSSCDAEVSCCVSVP